MMKQNKTNKLVISATQYDKRLIFMWLSLLAEPSNELP